MDKLKDELGRACSRCNWIHLASDKDIWRVLVNIEMNLRIPQNVGKFLSS
jgi:hypothetical protein